MAIKLNRVGVKAAKALVAQGKVEKDRPWEFDAADGNKLLGEEGDDWEAYARAFLAIDTSAEEDTKDRFEYPVIKDGKVSRRGVIAAKSRAAEEGAKDIEDEASMLLEGIDVKKDSAHIDASDAKVSKMVRHNDFLQGTDWFTTAMKKQPNGSYTGRACITNVGVFPYLDPKTGEIRNELRCPEAVMDPDSLATAAGIPLANEHPIEPVTPENYKKYAVGSVGTEVNNNETQVFAPVTINEQKAISDFETGKRGLSCGYDADVVFAPVTFPIYDWSGKKTGTKSYQCPGTYLGMTYDCIQVGIVYNHLALVKEGRAGDAARLRMDGALELHQNTRRRDNAMKKVHLDGGVEAEGDELLVGAYLKLHSDKKTVEAELEKEKADKTEKMDKAAKDKKELTDKMSALQAEKDSIEAEMKTCKDKISDMEKEKKDDKAIGAMVAERAGLISTARSLGIEAKFDSAPLDLKKACIAKINPSIKLDGKDEIYVTTAFDTCMSFRRDHADSRRAAETANGGTPIPGVESHMDESQKLEAARKAHTDSLTNLWQDAPAEKK